jgi:hypothetical protein
MHGGHDMGGMQMPGGLPMADRGPDRDGLKLDVLHVPLGPVLADWPSGLVIHTALQGDVIQDASVEVIGSGRRYWRDDPASICARRVDSCGRLLAVAGWESAAARARLIRDRVATGEADVRPDFRRWQRRVSRSRTLRWSLAGLGVLSGRDWDSTTFAGDAWDRLTRWIDQAEKALHSSTEFAPDVIDEPGTTRAVIQNLPALVTGGELAGARLVVASLDPDTDIAHDHD